DDGATSARHGRQYAAMRAVLVLAAVAAAVCLATAVAQTARFAHTAWRLHGRPEQLPRVNDLDPLAYFASTAALAGARGVIPRDATYAIVVGHEGVPDPELVRIVFCLWLLPRPFVASP